MAGVPWFFDKDSQAYKVRPGFKFPAIQLASGSDSAASPDPIVLLATAKKILAESEKLLDSLRQLVASLEGLTDTTST